MHLILKRHSSNSEAEATELLENLVRDVSSLLILVNESHTTDWMGIIGTVEYLKGVKIINTVIWSLLVKSNHTVTIN